CTRRWWTRTWTARSTGSLRVRRWSQRCYRCCDGVWAKRFAAASAPPRGSPVRKRRLEEVRHPCKATVQRDLAELVEHRRGGREDLHLTQTQGEFLRASWI